MPAAPAHRTADGVPALDERFARNRPAAIRAPRARWRRLRFPAANILAFSAVTDVDGHIEPVTVLLALVFAPLEGAALILRADEMLALGRTHVTSMQRTSRSTPSGSISGG